ncbi:MAG: hypothetical protein WC460_03095 [Patescibacteria group bacterium]
MNKDDIVKTDFGEFITVKSITESVIDSHPWLEPTDIEFISKKTDINLYVTVGHSEWISLIIKSYLELETNERTEIRIRR